MVIPDKSEGIWMINGMLTGSSWQVNSALQESVGLNMSGCKSTNID